MTKKTDNVTLHGAMPGHFYGNPGLAKRQDPSHGLSDRGKQSNTPGIRSAAGVAGKIVQLQSDCLRGFTLVFSFGIDSLSLSYPLDDHKAVVLFDPWLGVCS